MTTVVETLEPPPRVEPAPYDDAAASVWWRRLVRLVSVIAAVGLWQLLTANDVRLWLRFDTLPTVTEVFSAADIAAAPYAEVEAECRLAFRRATASPIPPALSRARPKFAGF